ncbi:MAG TPA: hypothetical protein VLU54_13430 [Casimicrobiaceae bacterium]|nr:hypothetical protein [Casimicrobiaceae bacterium]
MEGLTFRVAEARRVRRLRGHFRVRGNHFRFPPIRLAVGARPRLREIYSIQWLARDARQRFALTRSFPGALQQQSVDNIDQIFPHRGKDF